ncbi:MAG: pyridoxamine 5'-phosphate oxidase family protein, partial [Deltaproteobacteria bacterium]|nr:pyridoxamine 5'-phosphate oxidase family protein [Deltaproteobacteria bacterium]
MRRKHSEIADTMEIERILCSATIGRLATNGSDGYPYITPVNFLSYQGNVYFHSAPAGEKLDNLTRDPRVCFEVDIPLAYLDTGLDPDRRVSRLHQLYHCIIIRGEAHVVP